MAYTPLFLQIHALTSFSASLLNRDDAGAAKRIVFGGTPRTRISSQCLKRHWRTYQGPGSLGEIAELALRSRATFEAKIYNRLVAEDQVPEDLARAVVTALREGVLGKSKKAEDKEKTDKEKAKVAKAAKSAKKALAKEADALAALADGAVAPEMVDEDAEEDEDTGSGLLAKQVIVLGPAEVAYLLTLARDICNKEGITAKNAGKVVTATLEKEGRANLKAMGKGAGLDSAMFGRFITGDLFSRTDAAIHVSHAFTVHEEASESDYFSAVDDLVEQGSGHIGNVELTTGLYYTHVVVDVPLLVANITGCNPKDWAQEEGRTVAATAVESLLQIIAQVSPGAKLGSTAPYAFASMLMVEAGNGQPCSHANAFLSPVRQHGDILANTYRALANHLGQMDRMYPGSVPARRCLGMGEIATLLPVEGANLGLPGLAAWCAARVMGEEA